MGHEIVYCFKCQRRILGQEFEKGAAYQIGHHITCASCAAHLLETLPPKEKEQLLAQMFKSTQEHQKPRAAGQAPSSTRLRAQKTGHVPVLRPPADGASTPAIVGGVVAGGVVFVLILVVAFGSGGSRPPAPAPAPVPVPTPDEAPRRAAAQRALENARRFARENPRDFPGQVRAWEAAVDAADRTPFFEEARRELGALALRRKEAVSQELADLDARIRALLAAEDFKSAEVLLEEAHKRREGPDWTPAVDAKLRHVRETASRLFATLKAGAVDAPSRQALRQRIQKWGLPEFSVEPEPAPPVDDRPWTSMISKGPQSLRGEGHGGWREENGALVKMPTDSAAQTKMEIGDGEVRVRFEIAKATSLWFAVRQGAGETPHEARQDAPELEILGTTPHEIVFTCKGDTVTATLDGRPLAVKPGKAKRGLLQFNCSPPTAELRVLSLDIRPLRP